MLDKIIKNKIQRYRFGTPVTLAQIQAHLDNLEDSGVITKGNSADLEKLKVYFYNLGIR